MNLLKFDNACFRDFWQLLKPYWTSEEKYSAWGYFVLQMVCIVGEVRATVAINEFYKNFYDALQNFNYTVLLTSLTQFALILVALAVTAGYASYFNGVLSIRWRRWLTQHYLQKWLVSHHPKIKIDNPDQRISEDLEKLPTLTLSIFFKLFHATLTLITFGFILWNLSGETIFPGYLLFSAIFYVVIGTYFATWVGKKLATLNYAQQKANADLRCSLLRFKDGHQKRDIQHFGELFQVIYHNFIEIVIVNKRLLFFKNGYNTLSFWIGLALAIPLYVEKKIQIGGLMQISGAFSTVIFAVAMMVQEFPLFAEWRAVVDRLAEFNKKLTAPSLRIKQDYEYQC